MTESIRDIFDRNTGLLDDMDRAVYYFREQQNEKALCLVADSIDQIKYVIEAIINNREYFKLVTADSVLEMLSSILDAKKNEDYILLADLLELQLVNFLIGVQELIISKEEIIFNEDNYNENIKLLMERGTGFPNKLLEPIDTQELLKSGYRIEFTSCGQMTLAAENDESEFYFHTNSRIASEAFLLARHWYKEDCKTYIVYGFGMGYHIKALMELAKDARIEIYEADLNIMQLACAFSDIRELLCSDRITFTYDPEFTHLGSRLANLKQEEAFNVHYPSFKNIRNSDGRKLISEKLYESGE